VLRFRRPSASRIDRLLAAATTAVPTYAEVGATKNEQLPAGYRHDRYERRLGSGEAPFARAVAALWAWEAHRGAGARIFPPGAKVADDSTVILLIRVGGLWASLPCRVVYTYDAPDGFAFAYGTLPGHPETGEVAFGIERNNVSDEVVFRIVSFSRTVDPLARLASPVTRRIQVRVTEKYLSVIAKAAAGGA
jgi:uncharacterized protein (UPF0548 family)